MGELAKQKEMQPNLPVVWFAGKLGHGPAEEMECWGRVKTAEGKLSAWTFTLFLMRMNRI